MNSALILSIRFSLGASKPFSFRDYVEELGLFGKMLNQCRHFHLQIIYNTIQIPPCNSSFILLGLKVDVEGHDNFELGSGIGGIGWEGELKSPTRGV